MVSESKDAVPRIEPRSESSAEDILVDEEQENDESDDESDKKTANPPDSPWIQQSYLFLFHGICLSLYLVPILSPSQFNLGQPVMDEIHIISRDNNDINGNSSLATIFANDYWGRSIYSPSSHKSWRPFTVLTFRYLRGGALFKDLLSHRLVNVFTHAAIADMVGILAVRLVPSHPHPTLLRILTKLLWILHPTHVEVTANAANRPHLLALLCSILCCDTETNLAIFVLALAAGYLSSETFLFQTVPIIVTLTVIVYQQQRQHAKSLRGQVLPKVLVTVASALLYYGARYYYDTLSIPDGLIRPAENPFFEFQGGERLRNYLYVLSIHVAKAWDLDFIGFAQEYGFDCIQKIDSWTDTRLLIPLVMAMAYLWLGFIFLVRYFWKRPSISNAWWLYVVHIAWMVTLFPISGIVKVGTFVADRIVVASTVGVCILIAYGISNWLLLGSKKSLPRKYLALTLVGVYMWQRIHVRTMEWLDFVPLLKAGMKTCPRFAKAHLELSKVHSGTYPSMTNLTLARWHLEQAEAIDPNFCDVHQQFAQIALFEQKYVEFEDRLTQALLCPFTLGGSKPLWDRYWPMVMNPQQNSPEIVATAKQRYQMHMRVIQEHLAREEAKGEQSSRSSPVITWGRKK